MTHFDLTEDEKDNVIAEAQKVIAAIKPILAGRHAAVQGVALADLLSLWIAGHHPGIRSDILDSHVEHVRRLVPESERELFGTRGHPGVIEPWGLT